MATTQRSLPVSGRGGRRLGRRLRDCWQLYLLLLPAIAYFLVYSYAPFWGLQIAFKHFEVFRGVWDSPWVGLQHFHDMFGSQKFFDVIRNTLILSVLRLVFGFPVPIIFALLLNEVRVMWFRRSIQTVTYFPHFLSWVVFAGIVFNVLGPTGMLDTVLHQIGLPTVNFMTDPQIFRANLVVTGIVKEFGFSAIIYLAALGGIDPQLYEAAMVDGANRWRQTWHVTLPGLRPIMGVLLVLSIASIMDAGFDQVFNMYNSAVLGTGDIIDTYVYRIGLLDAQYEFATAVGIFKGIIGLVLIVSANHLLRRFGERSIW